LTAASLGWWSNRPDPGLNPSLPPQATEQTGLGFAENHEFGVVFSHPQEIEDDLFCLGK
jgi:hypothetical protein